MNVIALFTDNNVFWGGQGDCTTVLFQLLSFSVGRSKSVSNFAC
jgi:hypothetical protein